MKRVPQIQRNSRVRRERDVVALSRLALLLFCGVVLTCGFVFAAKQHFAAVQFGYQNEDLRRERQRLLEERRRLLLERERASSPARLEPAARKLGLKPATSGQIGSVTNKDTQANVVSAAGNPSRSPTRQ
ncbi:MAG TPA: cell division protein FtsL [Pyrinomonadaceae bacterium]|nr:cell division protein FtsL [Pyrinomonadaceae bacterium]